MTKEDERRKRKDKSMMANLERKLKDRFSNGGAGKNIMQKEKKILVADFISIAISKYPKDERKMTNVKFTSELYQLLAKLQDHMDY